MCYGRPSGIRTTQADRWVYELRRGNGTVLYLMFPVERLKQFAAKHTRADSIDIGDGGRFSVILLKLRDLLQ
jgi:hypothetical protein